MATDGLEQLAPDFIFLNTLEEKLSISPGVFITPAMK